MDENRGRTRIALDAQRDPQPSEEIIERLEAIVEDVGELVRQELHAAFLQEFQSLGTASARAAQALAAVRRVASVRMALWAIGVASACTVVPAAVVWTLLPTSGQLARLRHEREALAATVSRLRAAGGAIDLSHCGVRGRLCVRVERSGPAYGPHGDFLLVKAR